MWLQVYLRPIAVQMTICKMTWNLKTCFYGTLIGCNCCAFRDSELLPVLKGSIILPSFLVNKSTTNITITHKPKSCLHFSRASWTCFLIALMSSLPARHGSVISCAVLGDSFHFMLLFKRLVPSSMLFPFLFLLSFWWVIDDEVLFSWLGVAFIRGRWKVPNHVFSGDSRVSWSF